MSILRRKIFATLGGTSHYKQLACQLIPDMGMAKNFSVTCTESDGMAVPVGFERPNFAASGAEDEKKPAHLAVCRFEVGSETPQGLRRSRRAQGLYLRSRHAQRGQLSGGQLDQLRVRQRPQLAGGQILQRRVAQAADLAGAQSSQICRLN